MNTPLQFFMRIALVAILFGYGSGCRNLRQKTEPAAVNTNVSVPATQAAGTNVVSNAVNSKATREELDLLSAQSKTLLAQARTQQGNTNGAAIEVASDIVVTNRVFMPGNKILIQVWMRDNITQLSGFPIEVDVPESGRLFFPHIGLTQVEGRSASEIQAELQAKFSKILTLVTVLVIRKQEPALVKGADSVAAAAAAAVTNLPEAERPFKVVMLGRIAKPGVYTLTPGTRLRELMAESGDIAHYGHTRIYVVRGSADKPEVFRTDMTDIYKGIDLSGNILLRAHDAIFVDSKLLWKISDFMSLLLSPILQVRDTLFVYDRFYGPQ